MHLVIDLLSQYQVLKKTDVTVGNAVHMFQTFIFPFQPKNETVSQTVKTWKEGFDLSAPRLETIAWTAMYLKCFLVPNATHNSSTFISSTTEIASTRTSLSAVRFVLFFVLLLLLLLLLLCVAVFHTVCSMKKYWCVGLFVGASTYIVQVYFCE